MALFFLERPFSHLTTTNAAPTDAETSEIRQIMSRGRAHVRDLGIEIDRLQRTIVALRQERRDVQNRVDLHAAILSPIRRFPAEILGEIFRWTLPSSKARFISFTAQSPWNISRVSSRWRAICISSPDLWSHIRVHASRIFPVAALRIQLERSKPRSISIYFSWDGTDSNIDALAILVMSSTRWESASLIRPSGAMVLGLNTLSEREGCLPLLRELNFKRSDDRETCTAFETAPRLTDVSIDGSHRRLLVPLAQLTRLRLQMPRTPERLRLAVNLLQLTLGKASLTLPPPAYDEPIELPHLRMLFIADGRYLFSFLLPALVDICIKENAMFLPSFIDRSSCRLQKLTVIEELPNILGILDRAPTLREIRLRHPSAVSNLLRHLTIFLPSENDSSQLVCPNLHRITLCNIGQEEFALAITMLDSRRRRGTVSPIFLSVLQLDSESESTRCPYSFPSELHIAVQWVSGKPAQALCDGWRADYPGGGK